MFEILMGIPEMEALWSGLIERVQSGTASKKEYRLYQQLGKTMKLLSVNPRHPGLHSHDIEALSNRYGMKVWESYLENKTAGAGRLFWVYGPDKAQITIIGIEPHPNDKSIAYKRITLSSTGNSIE